VLVVSGCASDDGPGGSRPGETATDPTLAISDRIECAQPERRAEQVFVRHVIGEEWPKSADYRQPDWGLQEGSRGIAVADFDGDGIDDLFVPRDLWGSRVLLGNGDGTFRDVTDGSLTETVDGGNGATVADLDEDGDFDVFVYRLLKPPALLYNDGQAHFTVVTREDWDGDEGMSCGGTASLADFDNDGHLDLFYGRLGFRDPPNDFVFCDSFLFRGLGGGSWEDVSDRLTPSVQNQRVMSSGWWDLDDDGWQDLYVVSDCAPSPAPNRLLWNSAGSFTETQDTGTGVRLAGMGLGGGDLNDDGRPDLIVPGIEEYAYLVSAPEYGDIWVESSVGVGLDMEGAQAVGWGGEFVDFDNDGWLDTLATMGRDAGADNNPLWQPDALYRNLGDNHFEQVGEAWGWDEDTVMRGEMVVDLNDDGWLDTVKRELGGVVYVHIANCGEANWLAVTLHDPTQPNQHAIGAKVTVHTTSGRRHIRWVTAGSTSFTSGGPPDLHFGLGQDSEIERIEVRWPTGEITEYGGMQSNHRVDIWRE